MNLKLSKWHNLIRATAAAGAFALLGACSEVLDSTAGCPDVCGGQTTNVQNITLDAITYDTTVPSSFTLGAEPFIYIASVGTDVDTRAVLRFDSLPLTRISGTDTLPILDVRNARLHLTFDSIGATYIQPVTLRVYDLTAAANDTAVSDLEPLYSPSNQIGERVFPAGTLVDTVAIQLDSSHILNKVLTGAPLRIGVQAISAQPVELKMRAFSSSDFQGARISYRPGADTSIASVGISVNSRTPVGNPSAAFYQSDFTLYVKGTLPPPAPDLIQVGGLPARRGFLRVELPSNILDSSIIIRATLELSQYASSVSTPGDTITIAPTVSLAGPAITDPVRASQILATSWIDLGQSFTWFSTATETREIFITSALTRIWAQQDSLRLPRALVLRMPDEGLNYRAVYFYSSNAAPALRPRIKISYTPRTRIGLP